MDTAEPDVLAYMGFPAQHRVKLHSTNPLERLNGEIKRRTKVVGIFPNEAAITRVNAGPVVWHRLLYSTLREFIANPAYGCRLRLRPKPRHGQLRRGRRQGAGPAHAALGVAGVEAGRA